VRSGIAPVRRPAVPDLSLQATPSIDYQNGYGAYLSGAGLVDNPCTPNVRAYLDWENGWLRARDDELS
jgi:hypothetical protein